VSVNIIELGGVGSCEFAGEQILGTDTGKSVGGDSVPGVGIGVAERVLAEEHDECDGSSSETATEKAANELEDDGDAAATGGHALVCVHVCSFTSNLLIIKI